MLLTHVDALPLIDEEDNLSKPSGGCAFVVLMVLVPLMVAEVHAGLALIQANVGYCSREQHMMAVLWPI